MRRGDVEKINVPRPPEDTYDDAVEDTLPAVAAGVALFCVAMTVLHVTTLQGTPRLVMVLAAGGAAVVAAVVALVSGLRPLDSRFAHPATAGLVLMVVAVAVTGMVLLEQPRQSLVVVLAVVLAGISLLSLRWLVATLYLTWGAWAAAAVLVGAAPQWPDYALGMVAATCLALGVNLLRRNAVRELAAARDEAEASAVRDHLTGLANRRGLALVGGQIVEQARRQGDAAHCIFVDIDGLKRVNDLCGHAAGDEVIVAVADALRSVTRATDVVARWGGDEFCVVGPGAGMAPLELERRIRDNVRAHPPVADDVWVARVSAGGAMLEPWDSGSLETLLNKADQEMYLRRSLRREGPSPTRRPASTE